LTVRAILVAAIVCASAPALAATALLSITNPKTGSATVNGDGISVDVTPTTPGWYIGRGMSAQANADSGGMDTTLAASATTGQTTAALASTVGVKVGDWVSILLDNGSVFRPSVAGMVGGVVAFSPGQAFPSPAGAGRMVYDYKGGIQGGIDNGIATSAGRHWGAVEGREVNISMRAGSSALVKAWLSVAANNDDAEHGKITDAAIDISQQAGGVGAYTLISISNSHGQMPLTAGGDVMRAQGYPVAAKDFFDLSLLSCTGFYLNFANFKVDCNGGVSAGSISAQKFTHTANEFDLSYVYATPSDGATVTMASNTGTLILNPSADRAALGVNLPGCNGPNDGYVARFSTTRAVGALTMGTNGGIGTISNPRATLAAGEGHAYICHGADWTYYPLN
jgi:hypothetical protein